MTTESTMLSDIERAAIDRLKERGLPQVTAYEIKKDSELAPATPAVRAVIADGKFTPVGQKSFRADVTLYVIIIFKHVSDEESRRKGIYPILFGAVNLLAGQKLGLKIDELVPLSFREITNARDAEAGLIVFQAPFSTKFYFEKVSDEEAGALVKMGLDFYLQDSPDETPDTSSVVELPQ